jgi:hypothetical protein
MASFMNLLLDDGTAVSNPNLQFSRRLGHFLCGDRDGQHLFEFPNAKIPPSAEATFSAAASINWIFQTR